MITEQQYREAFRTGLFELILVISKSEDGHTAMVQAGEIIDEMLTAIALLGHGSAEVSSPAKMRRKCDDLARTIQRRMSAFQQRDKRADSNWFQTFNIEGEH